MSLLLVGLGGAKAQSLYDGALFTHKELSGTARFVGMGGALGALGADISTMGTNPAGIGLYRNSDANITFGYSNTQIKSDYMGNKYSNDANKFNMPNIGFVFSFNTGLTSLKYLNVGFNYNRVANFNEKVEMGGVLNRGSSNRIPSIANVMANQANNIFEYDGIDVADLSGNNLYGNNRVGWLAGIGYDGYFTNLDKDDGYYYDISQNDVHLYSKTRGGIDQYDFNLSGNVNDRFFWGLTVGAYDIKYNRDTYYEEYYGASPQGKDLYGLINTYKEVNGSGFDFKFGVIVRPIDSSPFRLGLAVHSPVFYNLKHYTYAEAKSHRIDPEIAGDVEEVTSTIFPNDAYDGLDLLSEYKLRTPWKTNLSLGHNIGDFLALGVEYEYQDYSSMKFNNVYNGFYKGQTSMLDKVHTVRLGLEYRIVPEFAFRLGYNYQTSIFKKDAYYDLPINSAQTDIQYANNKDRNTFTMGLGYAGKMFYADLGFKFDWYKSDFRPFDDTELNFTKLTTNRSQILLTLGMRL